MNGQTAIVRKPGRRTRQRVMELLKGTGGMDAAELATAVGVSPMAVRQHLYALAAEGLVTFEEAVGSVGRPAKIWQLSAAAERHFPDAHRELALDLVDAVRAVFGEAGMARLVQARAAAQTLSYAKRLAGHDDLADRLEALARIRSGEGYMASVQATEDGFILAESHCPICSAARRCTGLCAAELDTFQAALGADVEISRTDHILAGASRCAYSVRQKRG